MIPQSALPDNFFVHIFPVLHTTFVSIIPFSLLIVCNTLIIIKLIRTKTVRQRSLHVQSQDSQTTGITVTLLVVSFAFIILCLPNALFLNIIRYLQPVPGTHFFAKCFLFFNVAGVMLVLNHTVNFLLYCITGAKFRNELLLMLKCSKGT